MESNRNNFDLLRLVLATAVLLVHASHLSGVAELRFFGTFLNANHAVLGFFVVSGYLITMSYERSRSLRRFAVKRARRLLPAYVTVIAVAAVAGILVTTLSPAEYVASPGLYAYLAANLTFLNFLTPSLPAVFEANPYGPAVNGALWSIRSELLCYAAVPVVYAVAIRFGRGVACASAVAVNLGASAVLLGMSRRDPSPAIEMLRLAFSDCGLCFSLGVAAYYFRGHLRGPCFAVAGVTSLAVLVSGVDLGPWAEVVLRPVFLASAVLYAGLGLPYLGNWGRYGDISCGVYICHFPVIQGLVAAGVFLASPYGGLALAAGVTVVLAFLSWRYIEAPWLAADSHYIRAEHSVTAESDSTPARRTDP